MRNWFPTFATDIFTLYIYRNGLEIEFEFDRRFNQNFMTFAVRSLLDRRARKPRRSTHNGSLLHISFSRHSRGVRNSARTASRVTMEPGEFDISPDFQLKASIPTRRPELLNQGNPLANSGSFFVIWTEK